MRLTEIIWRVDNGILNHCVSIGPGVSRRGERGGGEGNNFSCDCFHIMHGVAWTLPVFEMCLSWIGNTTDRKKTPRESHSLTFYWSTTGNPLTGTFSSLTSYAPWPHTNLQPTHNPWSSHVTKSRLYSWSGLWIRVNGSIPENRIGRWRMTPGWNSYIQEGNAGGTVRVETPQRQSTFMVTGSGGEARSRRQIHTQIDRCFWRVIKRIPGNCVNSTDFI